MSVVSRQRFVPALVPTLLVVAVVELVVHRMVLTALKPGLLEEVGPAYEILATFSPFFYHLTCLLAVAALTWMVADLVRDRSSGPMVWRIVLGLVFCTFLPVAAVGALVSSSQEPMPYRSVSVLVPYLNIFFFSAVVCVVGISWARPLPLRVRAALVMMAVPLLVLSVSRFVTWMAGSAGPSPLVYRMAEKGRTLVLLSGYWLFALLAPAVSEPGQGGVAWNRVRAAVTGRLHAWMHAVTDPAGVALAAAFVGVVGVLSKLYFAVARKLVEASLGLDLVPASGEALAYLGSLFFFVNLVVVLALKDRPGRVQAMGLSLAALGGYQLVEPLGYLLGMAGLAALFRGSVLGHRVAEPAEEAALGPPLVEARWRAYLNVLKVRLSETVGDLEVAAVTTAGVQVSRVFGKWRTAVVDLRFVRRQGRLASVEATIGEVPSGSADWVLISRPAHPGGAGKAREGRAEAGRAPSVGPEDRTSGRGSAPSKSVFLVDDREGLTERLLKPEDRERAAEIVTGRVAVWWGIGVKFWADPAAPGGVERLVPVSELTGPGEGQPSPGLIPEVTALLGLLAERAGIVAASEKR